MNGSLIYFTMDAAAKINPQELQTDVSAPPRKGLVSTLWHKLKRENLAQPTLHLRLNPAKNTNG